MYREVQRDERTVLVSFTCNLHRGKMGEIQICEIWIIWIQIIVSSVLFHTFSPVFQQPSPFKIKPKKKKKKCKPNKRKEKSSWSMQDVFAQAVCFKVPLLKIVLLPKELVPASMCMCVCPQRNWGHVREKEGLMFNKMIPDCLINIPHK